MNLAISISALGLLLSNVVYGQSIYEKTDKIYNVYRRDSSVVRSYNIEFAKRIKKADSVAENDAVIAYVSKKYKGNKSLNDITIYVNLVFEAKDNRARLTFNKVTYKAQEGDGEYPLFGNLEDLKGYYPGQIKNDYKKFTESIFSEYKDFLKEKSGDDNW